VGPTAAHSVLGLTYPWGVTSAPTEGVLRSTRGAIVGGLAVVISLISHVTAARSTPSAPTVIALVAVAIFIGVSSAGRQFGFARAAIVLGATQPLLHVIAAEPAVVGHHVDSGVSTVSHQVTASMVLAHLVATVLAAALMSTLDLALWRWLCCQFTRLVALVPALSLNVDEIKCRAGSALRELWSVWLLSSPWRGPPARSALAALA